MFERSAAYYDAIYSFRDYAADAAMIREIISSRAPHAATLLDVGCGTGKHLELLRESYACEGIDLDEGLLEIARARLPGMPLGRLDMEAFDLGRNFDAIICMFGVAAYAKTEDRMRRAIASMERHLAPGGVLIVEPWIPPERFREGFVGFLTVDEDTLKVARMNTTVRDGDTVRMLMHYLVGTSSGIEHFTEEHHVGLFSVEQYERAFAAVGLESSYDPDGPLGRGLFAAVKSVN